MGLIQSNEIETSKYSDGQLAYVLIANEGSKEKTKPQAFVKHPHSRSIDTLIETANE